MTFPSAVCGVEYASSARARACVCVICVYLCVASILQTGGAIEHRKTGDMDNGHEGVLRVTRKIIRFENNMNSEEIAG